MDPVVPNSEMKGPDPRLVRRAQLADLPQLEALKRGMGYFPSLFHDRQSYFQSSLERLREYLSRTEELPDCRLLVLVEDQKPCGYLMFVVDEEHGVTHQRQSRILDFAVSSFADLQALTIRARKIVTAFENDYMVVPLLASDRRRQVWFYRCGFRAEQQRSVKPIPRGHQGASNPAFGLRRARSEDLPAILEVHSAYSHAYLPAGRDVDLESLEFRYQLTYLALDLDGSDGSHYLVMEEESSGALAGYIFVQSGPVFGDQKGYYMYDIAVAPAFAGRGLSRYLVGAAETLAGREGGLLYGDGSLNTPVIASWHSQMGAVLDSTLFALDCRLGSLHVNKM